MAEKTERELAQTSIAENRKAFHDYHILQTWDAGVVLLGTEVKAIREGRVNLRDSYARLEKGEVWLLNMHISPYSHRGYVGHEERRQRKLLLHRREIERIFAQLRENGLTLVPTKLYFKDGRVKVEVALARGKNVRDKRQTLVERIKQADLPEPFHTEVREAYKTAFAKNGSATQHFYAC